MKKIFTVLLLVFLSANGFSQVGFLTGFGLSTFNYDSGEYDEYFSTIPAFSVKIGAFYEIGLNDIVYLKPGLNYINKGGTSVYDDYTYYDEMLINSSYLNFPLDVRFKFGSSAKFILDVGLNLGYCLGMKSDYYSYDNEYYDYELIRGDEFSSMELALNLGAGVQFSNFQITGDLSYGLSNAIANNFLGADASNLTFCATFAYVLKSKKDVKVKKPSRSRVSSGE